MNIYAAIRPESGPQPWLWRCDEGLGAQSEKPWRFAASRCSIGWPRAPWSEVCSRDSRPKHGAAPEVQHGIGSSIPPRGGLTLDNERAGNQWILFGCRIGRNLRR